MSISPELIYQVVSIVLIPIIVAIARKLKLPSKWCPIAAFGVALVLVSAGKVFGIELDINNIGQLIMTALATAGISVIGYDQIKGLTTPKDPVK